MLRSGLDYQIRECCWNIYRVLPVDRKTRPMKFITRNKLDPTHSCVTVRIRCEGNHDMAIGADSAVLDECGGTSGGTAAHCGELRRTEDLERGAVVIADVYGANPR